MQLSKLNEAISEAERFLKKAKEMKASGTFFLYQGAKVYNFGATASGAAKRSSMDLTRALANFRKP